MIRDKRYLGDAVYAGHDGYQIWIWTSDGINESNKIALESEVLDALSRYRNELLERVSASRGEGSSNV